MKKTIAFLLCVVLAAQLCGCFRIIDNGDPQPEDSTSGTTAAPQSTAPQPVQDPQEKVPMICLALPTLQYSVYAEDGTLLFYHTYPSPVFQFEDTAVAEKVLLDLLNRIDAVNSEVSRIREDAKDSYPPQDAAFPSTPYFVKINYRAERIDRNLLSLSGEQIFYQGAVHPECSPVSLTYDLVTGNRLKLQDILSDDFSPETLCELVLEALSPKAEELYGEYAAIITDRFSQAWLDNGDWYLSGQGLCFYFTPYEIAPFSAGIVTAEIPYEKLSGILLDGYFPPETVLTEGTVSAQVFNQEDAARFQRFSEVILDSEGEKILLYTDGCVTDVRIRLGTWTEDGLDFIPEAMVFAANSLSKGDAVLLQAAIPDTMSNLQLQYTSNGETVTKYISQSGKDGSILVMDF